LPISKGEVGRKIDFPGLTYAPINEQGVVLLFGKLCDELGFSVEAIHQGFPDAEVIDYRANPSRGKRKKIEFEYASSNFLRQKHNSADCDIIVCWEDDWRNRSNELEVIELRSEVSKLKGEERDAQKAIEKRRITLKEQSQTGAKKLSGWEAHKRILTSSDAVAKRITEAKTRGVSQKYLRFLERLKRYWEIRESHKIAKEAYKSWKAKGEIA
jgi:hypothetical protein